MYTHPLDRGPIHLPSNSNSRHSRSHDASIMRQSQNLTAPVAAPSKSTSSAVPPNVGQGFSINSANATFDPLRHSLKRKKSSSNISNAADHLGFSGIQRSDQREVRASSIAWGSTQATTPSSSSTLVPHATTTHSSGSTAMHRSRKEKEKEKDKTVISIEHPQLPYHYQRRPVYQPPELSEKDQVRPTVEKQYSGPLAIAEFDRMRKELDALRKSLVDTKKTAKKQAKQINELKAEVSAGALAIKERDLEICTVKAKSRKSEELISTIENSIQCQICMDLPHKPFALAPCGHILCLLCLQEWFRTAPSSAIDEMYIDEEDLTDPQYIMMRSKSCPCCRAVVKRRPVPVFMVKAVAAALIKDKPSLAVPRPISPSGTGEDDPWKGIFPPSDEDEESSEDSDEFEDVDDSDWPEVDRFHHRGFRVATMSDSDDDDDEEDYEDGEEEEESDDDSNAPEYVTPQWEPPSVDIDPDDWDFQDEDPVATLKLLRRGCSWDMLQNYDIVYAHSMGIILFLHSLDHLYRDAEDNQAGYGTRGGMGLHRIYLGWNITLPADDLDGEEFTLGMLNEIKAHPERWRITPRRDFAGFFDARRLVRRASVEDYNTTDTDAWLDNDEMEDVDNDTD